MPRPILATIHNHALRHNLAQMRRFAPHAKIFTILKANAYGHGIARVWSALSGGDGCAVLDLDEAQLLRELGYRGPILLLEGIFDARDLELCSRLALWHVVHSSAQIDYLAAHKTEYRHRVFLKLNSGMQRLGFAPAAFRSAFAQVQALPQVEDVVLMTHFANADSKADTDASTVGPVSLTQQLACFNACTQDLPGERTLCNSAATLLHGQNAALAADWVRPGIAVYGASPDFPTHSIHDWGLLPTMSLSSKIISVQQLQPGDSVGYGSSYTANTAQRVGVVACGYADGYPRHAPTGTPVLVENKRSRILGRVSMDMLCVDLEQHPQAGIGSEVTLWGYAGAHNGAPSFAHQPSAKGDTAVLPIDEVAHAAGTIAYELMCALAARVPVRVL